MIYRTTIRNCLTSVSDIKHIKPSRLLETDEPNTLVNLLSLVISYLYKTVTQLLTQLLFERSY